jgi:uncharacterized protein YdhG (YjbR/CyaY superfamily)
MATKSNKSGDVDAYISAFPSKTQHALEVLRSCIWASAPNLSELINYGIPAFALVPNGKRDQQVMIAGFANHVGFYPSPIVIEAFSTQLSKYRSAKGSVQFPLDTPIPKQLITKMVKYKLSTLREQ